MRKIVINEASRSRLQAACVWLLPRFDSSEAIGGVGQISPVLLSTLPLHSVSRALDRLTEITAPNWQCEVFDLADLLGDGDIAWVDPEPSSISDVAAGC